MTSISFSITRVNRLRRAAERASAVTRNSGQGGTAASATRRFSPRRTPRRVAGADLCREGDDQEGRHAHPSSRRYRNDLPGHRHLSGRQLRLQDRDHGAVHRRLGNRVLTDVLGELVVIGGGRMLSDAGAGSTEGGRRSRRPSTRPGPSRTSTRSWSGSTTEKAPRRTRWSASRRARRSSWLVIPETGLYTGVLIVGAVGSGQTSACMYPFAKQLLSRPPRGRRTPPAG